MDKKLLGFYGGHPAFTLIGDGQCSCDECRRNNKWTSIWTVFCYEYKGDTLCSDCFEKATRGLEFEKRYADQPTQWKYIVVGPNVLRMPREDYENEWQDDSRVQLMIWDSPTQYHFTRYGVQDIITKYHEEETFRWFTAYDSAEEALKAELPYKLKD